jgi:hypothetical protein
MKTHLKACITGSSVEVFEYGKPIIYGETRKSNKTSVLATKCQTNEFSRIISTYRTKSNIRRLISSNSYQWHKQDGTSFLPVFGTFTFADNVKDITQANKRYTDFIKRLNYVTFEAKVAKLQYLNIVEFQKRGAVHYHTLFFNLPYIDRIYDTFLDTWGNGWTKVDGLKNTDHVSAYVTKYLTKNGRDERLDGKKAFFTSRSLIRPTILNNEQSVLSLLKGINQCTTEYETYRREYQDYSGQTVTYNRFKFDDFVCAKKLLGG